MNFEANAIYEAKLLLLALPHKSQSDRGLRQTKFYAASALCWF